MEVTCERVTKVVEYKVSLQLDERELDDLIRICGWDGTISSALEEKGRISTSTEKERIRSTLARLYSNLGEAKRKAG